MMMSTRMMSRRVKSGIRFSAALAAALFAFSLGSAAKTPPRHYVQRRAVAPSSDSKKLPRSTPNVALPTFKLANANAAEVQRIEHATVSQLHAESRSEPKAVGSGAPRLGDARGHEHSTAINFSYHAPQAGSREPGSVTRRR
jgi:hypothetical protein